MKEAQGQVKKIEVHKKERTRMVPLLGIMTAMSVILVYFVHFPLIPAAPFLEYDPADVPILIGGFAFGPLIGALLTLVTCVVQGLTVSAASGFYGILMHVVATMAYVVTASLIYNRHKTKKSAIIGLLAGSLAMTAIMVPANYVITPLFLGLPPSAITPLLGYIVLFNLLKSWINGIITFFLYKKISVYLHHR